MNPSKIWQIASKEILSTLRDRRALVSSLLIPLLILPVTMLGLPLALGGLFEREQATVTEVGVEGLAFLPDDLRSAFEAENVTLVETMTPEQDVREGVVQLALSVPENLAENLSEREQVALTLYSKRGNLRSELNAGKLTAAVAEFRRSLVAQRLAEVGLGPEVLEPIVTETVDASTEAERESGQFGWLVPFFIAVWTLVGGQMTAIDATAGEKERGTLEALLVAPVGRAEVVVGKFLATLTFGLSAALMAIIGYLLSGALLKRLFLPQLGSEGEEIAALLGGSFSISFSTIVLLIISALMLAALIAALLLSITMFARSFKEAQTYVAPLSFLLIIPVLGLQFADFFGSNPLIYLVPLLNAMLLMNDVVKGDVSLLPVLLTWGSLLALSALCLDFAYRSFKREGVIFRT